jgi:hypothetical protein
MSERMSVFVSVIMEDFGDSAHPFALEQVRLMMAEGDRNMVALWGEIANGIAATQNPEGLAS